MLWRGAPDPRVVLRRRLRAAIPAVLWQVGALAFVALGLSFIGAGEAIAFLLPILALFYVGFAVVRHGWATVAATRAARQTRVELTDEFLIIERGGQRHERRIANLPPLQLSMEGGDVGSIRYELPKAPVPTWLLTLTGAPESDLLVESVPDAARLFARLEAQRAPARVAPASAATPSAAPSESIATPSPAPSAVPWPTPIATHLPKRVLLGLAKVPWWIGAPFVLMGAGFAAVILVGSDGAGSTGGLAGSLLFLALPLLFALFGAAVLYARGWAFVTRRRLLSSGRRAMAEIVGIADANFEINDVPQWVVRYRYRVGGLGFGGESGMMPRSEALGWNPGDRVQIAYDPARPESSTWLGDALVPDEG